MAPLIVYGGAGLAIAGLWLLTRAIARRRRGGLERRRLAGLGTVDAHRERRL